MLGYLSYFSTSFIIAMILWPVVSIVLTLPILAGLYHRHHRLRAMSVLASYLSTLYFTGLIALTLYPMPDDPDRFCTVHAGDYTPQLNPLRFLEDLLTGGLYGLLQLLMNVVFFIPLGFVFTRWLRWTWWAVLSSGLVASLFIETSQLTGFWGLYPCAYRQFDVNDLMTNTLGAFVGFVIAKMFTRWVPQSALPGRDDVNTRPGAIHRVVAYVIDMLFVALVYFPATLAVVFAFHWLSTPLPNGDYTLFGGLITLGNGWLDGVAPSAAALAFLVFELAIPATHRGQTLGGMFTHMTIETVSRRGWSRVVFYAVRTLVLGLFTEMAIIGFIGADSDAFRSLLEYAILGFLIVFVFELLTRRAPWDLIAGNPSNPGNPSNNPANPANR